MEWCAHQCGRWNTLSALGAYWKFLSRKNAARNSQTVSPHATRVDRPRVYWPRSIAFIATRRRIIINELRACARALASAFRLRNVTGTSHQSASRACVRVFICISNGCFDGVYDDFDGTIWWPVCYYTVRLVIEATGASVWSTEGVQ